MQVGRGAPAGVCVVMAAATLLASAPAASIDGANEAWQRGDYISALNGYIQLLGAPDGDRYLERIALTTGELYRTYELTDDGRSGRFSPDDRYILYETGLETSRHTRILRNDDSRTVVAELDGVSATFTPDGSKVAYLRIHQTDDVRKAADAIGAATLTQDNRNGLVQMLTWLIARDSAIVVRDLQSGHELELPTPSMLKRGLTYGGDGRSLLFLGAREGNDTQTDIYTIAEGADGPALAVDSGGLKAPPIVDPTGSVLMYVIPAVSPLRRPEPPAGTAAAGPAAARPAVAATRPAQPVSTFAIVDLRSKSVSVVPGSAPTLSTDGKTLAYVAQAGSEFSLMVGPSAGLQTAVKRTVNRIDAPALSADGKRVAWQMMLRDDWEIFVADVAGSTLARERRVTRDIQHDVLPRFIGPNRLIAMVGEPRHRRSYLYELGSGEVSGSLSDSVSDAGPARVRLFHNNTVRTIAPEYQWAASADGAKLLVGAERDGDTVSPPRGVYLIDLGKKVTKAEVMTRLRDNLKSEVALRAGGTRAFQPIAAEVRQVLSHTSVDRVFQYEKSLFDFDSKHISKPGNRLASEFLFNTYKSFGYDPEYQWFDPSSGSGNQPHPAFGGKTANVVATLRGTVNPELVYVISSHYDSVEGGPGADDDTSGTAALLEAARVLASHPLPATVVFASMTGEEAGLLGSREFVRRAIADRAHIAGVLNNDMIGWMNDERMDNTIRYSNPGIRDIQHAAAMLFTKLITYDALYWKGTDAMSFYDAYGDIIGGIGSYPVLGSPYYHQASDLLENENHQLIAETAKTTVATIMLLASSPSRLTHLRVDTRSGGDVSLSWAPSAEKQVTSYIVAYGPPASPLQHRLTVSEPHAVLSQVQSGTVVSVKAVNARGLEGWDWARVRL